MKYEARRVSYEQSKNSPEAVFNYSRDSYHIEVKVVSIIVFKGVVSWF